MKNRSLLPMRFILILFSFTLLSSCGNYFTNKVSEEPLSQSAQEKLSADFTSVQQYIFIASCTSCHQQYGSYGSVIRELSAIQNAITTNRMPKSGGPLTENQKAVLNLWIANGAPENAGDPIRPNNPAPIEINWKSISENIIYPKCLVCHNPQGQAKFLNLSNRQVIFDQRNRVFAGNTKLIDLDDPDKSYLLEVILDPEEPMPPTSSNIPRLNQEEVQALKDWLKLGLP